MRELVAVGGSNNPVTLDACVGNLTADVLVRGANNHTILRSIVLVLVLDHETLAGVIISLTLTTPAELYLEPLEVSLSLDSLYEHL